MTAYFEASCVHETLLWAKKTPGWKSLSPTRIGSHAIYAPPNEMGSEYHQANHVQQTAGVKNGCQRETWGCGEWGVNRNSLRRKEHRWIDMWSRSFRAGFQPFRWKHRYIYKFYLSTHHHLQALLLFSSHRKLRWMHVNLMCSTGLLLENLVECSLFSNQLPSGI